MAVSDSSGSMAARCGWRSLDRATQCRYRLPDPGRAAIISVGAAGLLFIVAKRS
jgi:hypothetical protein